MVMRHGQIAESGVSPHHTRRSPRIIDCDEVKRLRTLVLNSLRTIKAVHTAIWIILAACILAIPVLGWAEIFQPDFDTCCVHEDGLIDISIGYGCLQKHPCTQVLNDVEKRWRFVNL